MKKNVQPLERAICLAAATFLFRRGLKTKSLQSLPSLLLGGLLGQRGLTGYCNIYNALGISTLPRPRLKPTDLSLQLPLSIRQSVVINRSQQEVFDYITQFSNLTPLFDQQKGLYRRGNNRWMIELPVGKRLNWDVVITKQNAPNEIEFSISNSDKKISQFNYKGRISLKPKANEKRTMLNAEFAFKAESGLAEKAIASSLTTFTENLIKEVLRKVKNLMEAGEIPTINGQPRGPKYPLFAIKKTSFLREQDRQEEESTKPESVTDSSTKTAESEIAHKNDRDWQKNLESGRAS